LILRLGAQGIHRNMGLFIGPKRRWTGIFIQTGVPFIDPQTRRTWIHRNMGLFIGPKRRWTGIFIQTGVKFIDPQTRSTGYTQKYGIIHWSQEKMGRDIYTDRSAIY